MRRGASPLRRPDRAPPVARWPGATLADGAFRASGRAVGGFELAPVNLELMAEGEREAALEALAALYDAVPRPFTLLSVPADRPPSEHLGAIEERLGSRRARDWYRPYAALYRELAAAPRRPLRRAYLLLDAPSAPELERATGVVGRMAEEQGMAVRPVAPDGLAALWADLARVGRLSRACRDRGRRGRARGCRARAPLAGRDRARLAQRAARGARRRRGRDAGSPPLAPGSDGVPHHAVSARCAPPSGWRRSAASSPTSPASAWARPRSPAGGGSTRARGGCTSSTRCSCSKRPTGPACASGPSSCAWRRRAPTSTLSRRRSGSPTPGPRCCRGPRRARSPRATSTRAPSQPRCSMPRPTCTSPRATSTGSPGGPAPRSCSTASPTPATTRSCWARPAPARRCSREPRWGAASCAGSGSSRSTRWATTAASPPSSGARTSSSGAGRASTRSRSRAPPPRSA